MLGCEGRRQTCPPGTTQRGGGWVGSGTGKSCRYWNLMAPVVVVVAAGRGGLSWLPSWAVGCGHGIPLGTAFHLCHHCSTTGFLAPPFAWFSLPGSPASGTEAPEELGRDPGEALALTSPQQSFFSHRAPPHQGHGPFTPL